jgi:biotin carboxylase
MSPSSAGAPGAARVLVAGGGPFQLDIIHAVRRLGAESVVVDRDPGAPGMALGDHREAVDTTDVEAVVAVGRRYAVDAAVTAASDAAVYAVAAVVEDRGLVGLPTAVARTCRDKLATFTRVRDAGLAVPETRLARDAAEAAALATAVGGYPLVVKPRSSAGGRGVSIVRSPSELADAVARATGYGGDGVLVQAFVGGLSAGVEAFFWRGALHRAFVLNDQYRDGFVSPVGHSLPSSLDPAARQSVVDAAARFAAACGITDGPANFDLRLVDGETVLIEINPRLGGSSITELVRTCYGADLSAATVLAALGRSPDEPLTLGEALPVAARLLVGRGRGPLRLAGEPGASWSGHEDVLSLVVNVVDGAPARLAVDDWSLFGSCLVRGATLEAAEVFAARLAGDVEAAITVMP